MCVSFCSAIDRKREREEGRERERKKKDERDRRVEESDYWMILG